MAGAGDLDGDGFGDVVVAGPYAYGEDWDCRPDCGEVWVFRGAPTPAGIVPSPAAIVSVPDPNLSHQGRFGWGIAAGGDVNGDGRPDVVIGMPGYDTDGDSGTTRGALVVELEGFVTPTPAAGTPTPAPTPEGEPTPDPTPEAIEPLENASGGCQGSPFGSAAARIGWMFPLALAMVGRMAQRGR